MTIFALTNRALRYLALTVLALGVWQVSIPGHALAQSQAGGTGRVEGVVIGEDDTGLLEGAQVRLQGTRYETFSNAQGFFVFRDVPAGS